MEKILWSEYYYCHSCFTEKQLVSRRYRIWTKKTVSKGSSTNHYNTYYLSLSFGSCWKIKIIHFIENILPWRISSTLLWCRCLIIAGCLCYRYLQSWDRSRIGRGPKGVGSWETTWKSWKKETLNNWQRLKSHRIENTQSLFLLEHEQIHFHQADASI